MRYKPQAQFTHFAAPKFYSGGQTNLPAAMNDAATWNQGMLIVITDGIVSIERAQKLSSTRNSDEACAAGSDSVCLAQAVAGYVRRGNGFWIVAMRMPFNGPYFVEEPGPFSHRGQVLRGPFPRHPLHLWIGSPSVTMGREVVDRLTRFATAEGLEVLAMEAAPGKWTQWMAKSPLRQTNIRGDDSCADGDKIGTLHDDSAPPRLEVRQARAPWHLFGGHEVPSPCFGVAFPVASSPAEPQGVRPLLLAGPGSHCGATGRSYGARYPVNESGVRG